MELTVGTSIEYTSAAGRRSAQIAQIRVAPTARPGFLNTWLTLDVPVQKGVKYAHSVQIPADNSSIQAFKIAVV